MSAPVNPPDPSMPEPRKRPAGVGTGPAGTPATRADADDDEDEWRHEPVAPVDEPNPLRSLGKAVGDTVTGSGADTPASPKR